MKTTFKIVILVLMIGTGFISYGQDKVYKDGPVWSVSFVRTNAGMNDEYIKSLKDTWKAVHDEAMKEGLIMSYKILQGASANPQDWDIMLLVEFKNLAIMESSDDQWNAIFKKVIGDEAATKKLMETRTTIRTIYGEKLMREVVFK
jgi:hypothetical protein